MTQEAEEPQEPRPSALALRRAVEAGDIAAVTQMLRAGLSPDARESENAPTPLHLAVRKRNFPLVQLLVTQGADPALFSPAKQGRNAYHEAALSTPEIMEYLLRQPQRDAAGAFYMERLRGNEVRYSPLRLALQSESAEMVTLLLDHGISANEPDENGETPLHFIAGHRKSREGALPMIRLLIERGADIDAKAANFWDETPLFSAVRDSFTDGVKLLVDFGADARRKNHFGETLLHLNAETWDADIAKILIAQGVGLEDKNRIGRTALHIAASKNKLDVVKTLLAAGADPFAKDQQGRTPDALCLADFQKNTHREILRKQMELEARHMHRPHPGYHARQRREAERKNGPFRHRGNGR